MKEKEMAQKIRQKEMELNLKVFKAFPKDKLDFKPHERSRTAGEIMAVFINEERANLGIADGKVDFSKMPRDKFNSLDDILKAYTKVHGEVDEKIKNLPEEAFNEQVDFAGMPMRRGDAFRSMGLDNIHHRGQLSVYLRMAGGKVPSIYGPSADEPMQGMENSGDI